MPRTRLAPLVCLLTAAALGASATALNARKPAPVVTREVIAVYLGTEGTDARSGMIPAVRDLKVALRRQATATDRQFILRGVSLEASVEGGLRHLALFGAFDEVSAGGNWTNSAVVRYLGGHIGLDRTTGIPQVVLFEREVRQESSDLQVGPEREIARFVGTKEIGTWVSRGAPLPQ